MPQCRHCLIEFPEHEAVRHDGLLFCCNGCMGIYRMIHEEGLDGFYDRRGRDWAPGPSAKATFDVEAFAERLRPVGDEIEADISIGGIRCASCVWLNEKILQRTRGISKANVNYATHRARVRFDPRQIALKDVLGRIASIGYSPRPYSPGEEDEIRRRETRSLLMRFGTAAFFSMQLMIYSVALYAGYFQGIDPRLGAFFKLLAMALATPVLFYSGWPFIRDGLSGARHGVMNMDVLVALGAGAAYAYSVYNVFTGGEVYFDTSSMIVTFVLLGRYIESGAKGRASEAVSRLLSLSPANAIVIGEGGERVEIEVSKVTPGMVVEVLPGGRVPLDGIVAEGASELDESMLTGESRPVAKGAGDEVFAGTVNKFGAFTFRVSRTGRDTVLSRIVAAVEEAQSRRAPVQGIADRTIGYFVPLVLALSALTLAVRLYLGFTAEEALMNAVSVLVIACPCALGLATPLAIVIGTASGARRGVLIRGADVIEAASRIDHIVLDKTGTVTEGRPALAWHLGMGGLSEADALLYMGSLEARSEHTIGRAIRDSLKTKPLDVQGFEAMPGLGIKGELSGMRAVAGSEALMQSEGVDMSDIGHVSGMISGLMQEGATVVYLAMDGRLSGVFAVSDRVRDDAADAVRSFRRMGVGVSIFTGDNEATARAVALRVGVDDVRSGISPIGKAEAIASMKAEGRRVMMIGDGINDAPALVEASVGVAMGRATDIALESADVVLMHGGLGLGADALMLSRRVFSVIKQNIFWAFFYNATAVPLAVAGVLHPIFAAAAMAFSSISVVGNSMRARLK